MRGFKIFLDICLLATLICQPETFFPQQVLWREQKCGGNAWILWNCRKKWFIHARFWEPTMRSWWKGLSDRQRDELKTLCPVDGFGEQGFAPFLSGMPDVGGRGVTVGRKSGGKKGCDEGPWAVGCIAVACCLSPFFKYWLESIFEEATSTRKPSLTCQSLSSKDRITASLVFVSTLSSLRSCSNWCLIFRFPQQIFNEHKLCPRVPRWLSG